MKQWVVSGMTATVLGVLLFPACSGPKEEAPFFDGLSLVYREIIGTPPKSIERTIEFRFKKENKEYTVTAEQNSTLPKPLKKSEADYLLFEGKSSFWIDKYGKVMEDLDGLASARAIRFWLPSAKRRIGATAFEWWKVKQKTNWRGWEVWALQPFGKELTTRYYNARNGLWIGEESAGGKRAMWLETTNAELIEARR